LTWLGCWISVICACTIGV